MVKSNTFGSVALLGLIAFAPSSYAGAAAIPIVQAGMPDGLAITEDFNPGTGQGNYAVQNNTAGYYLRGFGVSNPLSLASVEFYGDDFGCDVAPGFTNSWCYASKNLYDFNWASETAYFDDQLGPLSFQDIYGDFSDNVEPGENTINWYSAEDGALGPGDFEDFFLFEADFPASLALGILEDGPDTLFFNQAQVSQVPLPAAAWLFISALGGLVVAKRKQLKA